MWSIVYHLALDWQYSWQWFERRHQVGGSSLPFLKMDYRATEFLRNSMQQAGDTASPSEPLVGDP